MCISNSTEWSSAARPLYFSMQKKQRAKISRVQVHRLARRKRSEGKETKKDIEMRNLELYMENMSILEENEKLRKKASLLHQENIALMSEFQKKFSKFDKVSTKETPNPPTPKLTK
ncbi:protein LITTLE ZIPPER 1-like [Lycium barbarum]|uniref:protein LITTLE ZIPPER 1-like n=1 Tax=Lycium barbarum TaxID=112863 RepID=UPI00293ECD7F|nr:protein LITTLE ZIPPER 1-like [Lycium barbarum]